MDIESYKKYFDSQIEKNFNKLIPYFDIEVYFFSGVARLMNENFRCLVLDAHVASVALSNHIIERLLKITLINYDSFRATEEISIKAYNRYQGMPLRTSITNCFNKKLIDFDEKKHLEDVINDMVRNGFSHSSFENILKNVPVKIPAKMGNISSQESKDVEIDRRISLSVAELQMQNFAENNSFQYFKYTFELMHRLDELLKTRNNISDGL